MNIVNKIKEFNLVSIAVIAVVFIGLVSITFTGCNNNTPKQEPQQSTNVIYQGQIDGCVERYDELFCDDRYKVLNSDINGTVPDLYVDKNGTMIKLGADEVVDDNVTTYRIMPRKDK